MIPATHQTHWLWCAAMALMLRLTLPPLISSCPGLSNSLSTGNESKQLYFTSKCSLTCSSKQQSAAGL